MGISYRSNIAFFFQTPVPGFLWRFLLSFWHFCSIFCSVAQTSHDQSLHLFTTAAPNMATTHHNTTQHDIGSQALNSSSLLFIYYTMATSLLLLLLFFLFSWTDNPLSLQQLCRISVRTALGTKASEVIGQLDISRLIYSYLQYCDHPTLLDWKHLQVSTLACERLLPHFTLTIL